MQTINRNNYEEFFILYIDGELDAAGQLAVENFVQQNPDLAVELEMFMQAKLSPETIEFDNKEGLLRTEGHNINESNHEEFFLLYIDNELSPAKREEVERYVLQHPKLQEEFTTLKQAVLTPEVISYGNKEDLYRTEKRRTIYLRPWQWAAAAIFIGLCGVGVWMMQPGKNIEQPVATHKPAATVKPALENMASTPVKVDSSKEAAEQEPVIAQQTAPVKNEQNTIAIAPVVKKKKPAIQKPANNDDVAITTKQPVTKQNNDVTVITQLKEPPDEAFKIKTDATAPVKRQQQNNDVAAVQSPANNEGMQNGYKTYNVAYKELNTNDEDRSLRIGMLDLNKDKVKGFFKKAGRIFGKSNNNENEDGKLQVANFEIDTKKQ